MNVNRRPLELRGGAEVHLAWVQGPGEGPLGPWSMLHGGAVVLLSWVEWEASAWVSEPQPSSLRAWLDTQGQVPGPSG